MRATLWSLGGCFCRCRRCGCDVGFLVVVDQVLAVVKLIERAPLIVSGCISLPAHKVLRGLPLSEQLLVDDLLNFEVLLVLAGGRLVGGILHRRWRRRSSAERVVLGFVWKQVLNADDAVPTEVGVGLVEVQFVGECGHLSHHGEGTTLERRSLLACVKERLVGFPILEPHLVAYLKLQLAVLSIV